MEELTNMLKMLEHESILHFLYSIGLPRYIPEQTIFIPIAMLFILVAFRRGIPRGRIPTRYGAAIEFCYQWVSNFCASRIGARPGKLDDSKQFIPFMGTIFFLILTMNLLGLVPGAVVPTTDLRTTLGMALIAMTFIQIHGIKIHGAKGHFMHYVGDPLWMAPIMMPVHIVSELVRVLTLTVRLFGNMIAGHVIAMLELKSALWIMESATITIAGIHFGLPVPVPLIMLPVELFKGWIQAYIFVSLVAAYLKQVRSHEAHKPHGNHNDTLLEGAIP